MIAVAAPNVTRPDHGTAMILIRADEEASASLETGDVVALVRRATGATFYGIPLSEAQLAANARIPLMGGQAFFDAARSSRHRLLAAFADGCLAGFLIATRHAADDLELDWLMVDPAHHGSGLADRLMVGGLDWLGDAAPIWLTVLRHNHRAIAFYRRYGFDIDPAGRLDRVVPSWIMRRRVATAGAAMSPAGQSSA